MLSTDLAQYTHVSGTAAGTTVISVGKTNFYRVVLPINKTGTVTFYDSATAAGTTAGNYIVAIDNVVGTVSRSVEVGCRAKAGLVAVVGGTTDFTVIWN